MAPRIGGSGTLANPSERTGTMSVAVDPLGTELPRSLVAVGPSRREETICVVQWNMVVATIERGPWRRGGGTAGKTGRAQSGLKRQGNMYVLRDLQSLCPNGAAVGMPRWAPARAGMLRRVDAGRLILVDTSTSRRAEVLER